MKIFCVITHLTPIKKKKEWKFIFEFKFDWGIGFSRSFSNRNSVKHPKNLYYTDAIFVNSNLIGGLSLAYCIQYFKKGEKMVFVKNKLKR